MPFIWMQVQRKWLILCGRHFLPQIPVFKEIYAPCRSGSFSKLFRKERDAAHKGMIFFLAFHFLEFSPAFFFLNQ